MILGPILLAVALGLLAIRRTQPIRAVAAAPSRRSRGSWSVLGRIVPYAIVTVVFTFMYSSSPIPMCEFRAALIGGVTAGIIWALVGKVFTGVILYSSQMVAVYTGFAIVLTTLIWVYLSWLILLIGAQLAFYVQFPQYLRHGQDRFELTGSDREQVGAVDHVLDRARLSAAARAIGAPAGSPRNSTSPASRWRPCSRAWSAPACSVATEKEQFVPGRDPAGHPAGRHLGCRAHAARRPPGHRTCAESPRAAHVLNEVEAAMRQRLGARSLKDLIASSNR